MRIKKIRRTGTQAGPSVSGIVCLGIVALVIAMTGPASSANADESFWSPPPLTGDAGEIPDGREVVKRVVDFMKSHEDLRFDALFTYEVVQENGQKLQFDILQDVAIHRPKRMFWKILFDDATLETAWLQDGIFTLVRQPTNVWGRAVVPPDLSGAVVRLSEEYGITVPFIDLLSGDVEDLWLGEDVESVEYVGESWILGRWTDQVAIRKPGVDIQLWLDEGDEPFPVKMVVIRTEEEGMPGFWVRFNTWSTQLKKIDIPVFAPPEGSEQIEIVP